MQNDKFDRIEGKVDSIKDDITEIKVTLASQHVSLKEHMRRTDLLEAAFVPVQKHVNLVNGALKALGVVAILATIAEGVASILPYIKN